MGGKGASGEVGQGVPYGVNSRSRQILLGVFLKKPDLSQYFIHITYVKRREFMNFIWNHINIFLNSGKMKYVPFSCQMYHPIHWVSKEIFFFCLCFLYRSPWLYFNCNFIINLCISVMLRDISDEVFDDGLNTKVLSGKICLCHSQTTFVAKNLSLLTLLEHMSHSVKTTSD